jgi:hypothetical protein
MGETLDVLVRHRLASDDLRGSTRELGACRHRRREHVEEDAEIIRKIGARLHIATGDAGEIAAEVANLIRSISLGDREWAIGLAAASSGDDYDQEQADACDA